MKRITAMMLGCLIAWECVLSSGCSSDGQVRILDSAGQNIMLVDQISDERSELDDTVYRAYLELVLLEAEQIIRHSYNCDANEARRQLLEQKCVIYTAFDSGAFFSLKGAYEEQEAGGLSFGGAVTDLQGRLLAAYSAGGDGNTNFAAAKTPPYSAFKPLSVYTPAIEKDLAVWSSLYEDSPIKKIAGQNGQEADWPANATGTYTHENTDLSVAVKESLNTVAVRCMQTVGVSHALAYVKDTFGLSLDFEQNKAAVYGEEEVIGNVALGYLYEGVSPVEMAGCYQVFANGGNYCQPHTILKICDHQGKVIFENPGEKRQAIKTTTAYIMNQLLHEVVSPGGTGEKAACDGVAVAGKTGTGDNGNWFAGFTPEYVCTVWHGTERADNVACDIFSGTVAGLNNTPGAEFPDCAQVRQAAYCRESGMLLSQRCSKADMGYFAVDALPSVCSRH